MMKWGVTQDDDGNTHVVPIVPVSGFKTKREAKAFGERLERDNVLAFSDPDEEEESNVVRFVSFRHQLSINCVCHPTMKDEQIVHNVIQ